jgi:hypothetical protein
VLSRKSARIQHAVAPWALTNATAASVAKTREEKYGSRATAVTQVALFQNKARQGELFDHAGSLRTHCFQRTLFDADGVVRSTKQQMISDVGRKRHRGRADNARCVGQTGFASTSESTWKAVHLLDSSR